jgi:pimeloyl-ACP methyl ester carboxylesterase
MKLFPSLMLAVLMLPLDFLPAAEPAAPPVKELPLPGKVFAVAGRTAFVIESTAAPEPGTKAWVWYAPTLPRLPGGEETWLFEQFRAAGIGIAGIDAGECYGSPDGRKIYTALYEEMTTRRGFSKKPVLLGRSRGGLMTLSWAADHPDQVGCFAGIYPVCDLRSYPGIGKACGAYGMSEAELEATLANHNPVDRLAPLARAGVPFFAIHGDSDVVVPLETNSGAVQRRYAALGGKMELVIPQGQGHNMWEGFFRSPELVAFVKTHAKP